MWTEFIWLKIWSIDASLCVQKWTFGIHRRWGIYCPAE